jgi:tetratricopeptide (TPR) repeat protein
MSILPKSTSQRNVFVSYAREDTAFALHVKDALVPHGITAWFDQDELIMSAIDWKQAISNAIQQSQAFILLVSPDSRNSPEVQDELDMARAHNCAISLLWVRGEVWEDTVFKGMEKLQYNDARSADLKSGLKKLVDEIKKLLGLLYATGEEWAQEGTRCLKIGEYKEALDAYEQATHLGHVRPQLYTHMGDALMGLQHYNEALDAYERADRLAANKREEQVDARIGKGNALYEKKDYTGSLAVFQQTLTLNSHHHNVLIGKGKAHNGLRQYEEALQAYTNAAEIGPRDIHTQLGIADALLGLNRMKEALKAYEEAIQLDHRNGHAYRGKGAALNALERHQEALDAYEQAIRIDPTNALNFIGQGDVFANAFASLDFNRGERGVPWLQPWGGSAATFS